MAVFATNLGAIPALTQLHVNSSQRRVSISLDHISDLENRIQNTLVVIAKSRALIAQSDEVCNRVWETTLGRPSHQAKPTSPL
jgi:hypothetical protein